VQKYYIETTRDLVVSPALQERMIQSGQVRRVFKVNAGHASYITATDEVVRAIVEVAKN
jgi:hypothetical protein